MPRFYFNLDDSPDTEGAELAQIDIARREAVRAAGEMIRDLGRSGRIEREWRMFVADDAGRELIVLSFSISEASSR